MIYIPRSSPGISNNIRISEALFSLQLKLGDSCVNSSQFYCPCFRAACFYAVNIGGSQRNIAPDFIASEGNACQWRGRSCSTWQLVTDVDVIALNHCVDSLYSIFYSTSNKSRANKLKCSCQDQQQSWRHTYNIKYSRADAFSWKKCWNVFS